MKTIGLEKKTPKEDVEANFDHVKRGEAFIGVVIYGRNRNLGEGKFVFVSGETNNHFGLDTIASGFPSDIRVGFFGKGAIA